MAERLLTFERGGRAFSLRAAEVAEVAADRPLEPVPRAPSGVAGLAIERGRLLTVLDLDRMLRIRTEDSAVGYLVVLAAPWSNLALRVRADLTLEDEDARPVRPEPVEVARMVEAIEAVIATASRRGTGATVADTAGKP